VGLLKAPAAAVAVGAESPGEPRGSLYGFGVWQAVCIVVSRYKLFRTRGLPGCLVSNDPLGPLVVGNSDAGTPACG
jgi:hypothetical protein